MKVKKYFNEACIVNNHNVTVITDNSKEIIRNSIFFVIKGYKNNGFDFIDEAIKKGAKTIVSEEENILFFNYNNINFIYCENVLLELARVLKIHNQEYLNKISLICTTGTNAKTSICTLIYKYLNFIGVNSMYIGTNGVYFNDIIYQTNNTTLGIVNFYKCLKYAVNNNCKYIIMEVSSQGIKECRVKYIDFDIGVLSNVTIDHLDYHKTFDDYFYTKVNFLSSCKKVIINGSCDKYQDIIKTLNNKYIYTYGVEKLKTYKQFDYYATDLNLSIFESNFIFNVKKDNFKYYINTNLLGEFNISNLTAMLAVLDNLDNGKYFGNYIFDFLKEKIEISGRFEVLRNNSKTYVVDFAHTPDGILKVLSFLKKVCEGKLIVVLGMGGNRDKSKRQIVGEIVSRLADCFIVTSDNPRNEENDLIICDILKGVNNEVINKVIIIEKRYDAIKQGYLLMKENDVLAILGKGNEDVQIIKGIEYPFNDFKVLKEIISNHEG